LLPLSLLNLLRKERIGAVFVPWRRASPYGLA
jgi:hypothetical protein